VAPISTRAVLLRGHDYGDTSRILRFYTLDEGLISVMARGVRGRSGKGATAIATFASGELTAYVKPQRDLHTMKDFACARLREGLGQDVLRFAGASAAAELVLAHADQEPHPELFYALEQSLDALEIAAPDSTPTAALSAIWRITVGFGFAPQLEVCVRCGREVEAEELGRFDFSAGGVRCPDCADESTGPRVGPIARAQIVALLEGGAGVRISHPRRHLGLVSDFVAYHVVSRPLKSLHFLGSLLPPDQVASE
jgi:DNA repair protein RecO